MHEKNNNKKMQIY